MSFHIKYLTIPDMNVNAYSIKDMPAPNQYPISIYTIIISLDRIRFGRISSRESTIIYSNIITPWGDSDMRSFILEKRIPPYKISIL